MVAFESAKLASSSSGDSLQGTPYAGDDIIVVVDPASRKLPLPVSAVFSTLATTRHCERTPSLCMLFIQGRCRQGNNCHQVHADAGTVHRLRNEAASRPTCCVRHGDDHEGASVMAVAGRLNTFSIEGIGEFPVDMLATTKGSRKALDDLDASTTNVELSKSLVCRLHIVGRCRFSEDCNFVHVCGEITAEDPLLWGAPGRRNSGPSERRSKKPKHEKSPPLTHHAESPSHDSSFNSIPTGSMSGAPPSPPLHNNVCSSFLSNTGYSTPPTGLVHDLPPSMMRGCGLHQHCGDFMRFGSPTGPLPGTPQRSSMFPGEMNSMCCDSGSSMIATLTPLRTSMSTPTWTHDPYSWGSLTRVAIA